MNDEPVQMHTPGPWHIGSLPPPQWRYIAANDGSTVAAVSEWDKEGNLIQDFQNGSSKANARLISAAPEMLEALKALIKYRSAGHEVYGSACDQARAAIAKAEGRTLTNVKGF